MPATLSVWACALGLWRHFTGHGGFDPVNHQQYPGVLVDCLLYVSAHDVLSWDSSESPFQDMQDALTLALRGPHADVADVFALIEQRFRTEVRLGDIGWSS